jgi:hypothetical protein
MLFLTELLKLTIVFIAILKEIPRVSVSVVISIIVIIKVLETWPVVITFFETAVCFAHTHIEWLDQGLAGELDRMIETSDVVGFVKGVIELIEGSCLNVI